MGHDVDPGTPRIRQDGEHEFAGIQYRRGRVAQERHPRILLGFPERPTASGPLVLHPLMERVIIMGTVAIAELAIAEERRGVTGQEQRRKTSRYKNKRE